MDKLLKRSEVVRCATTLDPTTLAKCIACVGDLQWTDGVQQWDQLLDGTTFKEREAISNSLKIFCADIAQDESFLPSLQHEADEPQTTAQLNALSSCCMLVKAHADKGFSKTPPSLVEVLASLHELIFDLQTVESHCVRDNVLRACESWWIQGQPEREIVVAQLIPVLVVAALEDGATVADIKRLGAVKDALMLFDVVDESFDSLRELLLRCLLSPSFLNAKEGRAFLASLFLLDSTFTADLHETIKQQIAAPRSTLRIYGELYFRAWRMAVDSSNAEAQDAIENGCIQDLVFAAAHSAVSSTFSGARLLLDGFLKAKRVQGVDAALFRIYDAVIWRALTAAHPMVRHNAVVLLADAFPLQDPAGDRGETAGTMQRQFDALSSLLCDPNINVRCAAVEAVCQILSTFWELIPAAVSHALLGRLMKDLAFDARASAVRATVLEGVAFMVDCPLVHNTLKRMLPMLSPLLHDRSEKVRAAMASLLLTLSTLRTVQFVDVCLLEQVMARLVLDGGKPKIASKLVQLLQPSYAPSDVDSATKLQRALRLLADTPAAGAVFFRYLPQHMGVSDAAKLVLMLHKAVNSAIRKAKRAQDDDADIPADGSSLIQHGKRGRRGRNKKSARDTANRRKPVGDSASGELDGADASLEDADTAAAEATLLSLGDMSLATEGNAGSDSDGDAEAATGQRRGGSTSRLIATNLPLMVSILDAMQALLDGVAAQLFRRKAYATAAKKVKAVFTNAEEGGLKAWLEYFQQLAVAVGSDGAMARRACIGVLRIAGYMEDSVLVGLMEEGLWAQLASTPVDSPAAALAVEAAVRCMSAWDKADVVLSKISESLQTLWNGDWDMTADAQRRATGVSVVGGDAGTSGRRARGKGAKKGRGRRSSSAADKDTAAASTVLHPLIALTAFEVLISGSDPTAGASIFLTASAAPADSAIHAELAAARTAIAQGGHVLAQLLQGASADSECSNADQLLALAAARAVKAQALASLQEMAARVEAEGSQHDEESNSEEDEATAKLRRLQKASYKLPSELLELAKWCLEHLVSADGPVAASEETDQPTSIIERGVEATCTAMAALSDGVAMCAPCADVAEVLCAAFAADTLATRCLRWSGPMLRHAARLLFHSAQRMMTPQGLSMGGAGRALELCATLFRGIMLRPSRPQSGLHSDGPLDAAAVRVLRPHFMGLLKSFAQHNQLEAFFRTVLPILANGLPTQPARLQEMLDEVDMVTIDSVLPEASWLTVSLKAHAPVIVRSLLDCAEDAITEESSDENAQSLKYLALLSALARHTPADAMTACRADVVVHLQRSRAAFAKHTGLQEAVTAVSRGFDADADVMAHTL